MASTMSTTLLLITILTLTTTSEPLAAAAAPSITTALRLSTHKDSVTNLHVTSLETHNATIRLLVDLNGRFLWFVCEQKHLSPTYTAPFCHSAQCSRAGIHYCHKCPSSSPTPRPGCHNHTCGVLTTNPLTQKNAVSELTQDELSIPAFNNNNKSATIPNFLFACAPSNLLQGPFPQGLVGLGHAPVALPIQIASHFGLRPDFAVCLSPSTTDDGSVLFGNIPSSTLPRIMGYTPLTIGEQGEYYILIRSIVINNKTVPFNTSLLSRTRGFGGTMISTTTPYTVMERSVFTAFTEFFAEQLSGVPRVEAVRPFGVCFDARILPPTRVGAPNIDFVMQNRNVSWRVFGYDVLVRVRENVSCLAVVDGGTTARAAITIGAYQLENNFLHFDLVRSRFGFIPSRLAQPFDCSKLNFTGGGGGGGGDVDDEMGD